MVGSLPPMSGRAAAAARQVLPPPVAEAPGRHPPSTHAPWVYESRAEPPSRRRMPCARNCKSPWPPRRWRRGRRSKVAPLLLRLPPPPPPPPPPRRTLVLSLHRARAAPPPAQVEPYQRRAGGISRPPAQALQARRPLGRRVPQQVGAATARSNARRRHSAARRRPHPSLARRVNQGQGCLEIAPKLKCRRRAVRIKSNAVKNNKRSSNATTGLSGAPGPAAAMRRPF